MDIQTALREVHGLAAGDEDKIFDIARTYLKAKIASDDPGDAAEQLLALEVKLHRLAELEQQLREAKQLLAERSQMLAERRLQRAALEGVIAQRLEGTRRLDLHISSALKKAGRLQ